MVERSRSQMLATEGHCQQYLRKRGCRGVDLVKMQAKALKILAKMAPKIFPATPMTASKHCCECCQTTAGSANKSMLLRYNDSNRHKSSLAKLQYIFTGTFCDLQMSRCGR